MNDIIDYDLKDLRGDKVYFKYILDDNNSIKCKMYHRKTLDLFFHKFNIHFRIKVDRNEVTIEVGNIGGGGGGGVSKSDYYKAARRLLARYDEHIKNIVKEEKEANEHTLKMKNGRAEYRKNKIDLANNFKRQKGLIIKEADDSEYRRY